MSKIPYPNEVIKLKEERMTAGRLTNIILFSSIFLCLFYLNMLAEDSILEKVSELQRRARRSLQGTMGCGVGTFGLQVKDRIKKITSGLDPTCIRKESRHRRP